MIANGDLGPKISNREVASLTEMQDLCHLRLKLYYYTR